MRLTCLNSRVFRLVAIGILAGLLPITVVPSEKDVCGVSDVGDFMPAAVRPCPNPPLPTTVQGFICDPAYPASCMDEPCRCWTGRVCFRRGGVLICLTGTFCRDFVSTRVQRPRCRPASLSSTCVYRPYPCGQFTVYLGNCGGVILYKYDGWMHACG